nr:unnamed protein product [Digitaria exilis]
MGYAQLVIGPAGSGKVRVPDSPARFLFALGSLRGGLGRAMIGLVDGADIRELISLDDVMEERGMGPNGGLIYCMEYPVV